MAAAAPAFTCFFPPAPRPSPLLSTGHMHAKCVSPLLCRVRMFPSLHLPCTLHNALPPNPHPTPSTRSPGRFQGHFTDKGYNAIQLAYASNCWVRNVRINSSDNGLFAYSTSFTTVDSEFCSWSLQARRARVPCASLQQRPARLSPRVRPCACPACLPAHSPAQHPYLLPACMPAWRACMQQGCRALFQRHSRYGASRLSPSACHRMHASTPPPAPPHLQT